MTILYKDDKSIKYEKDHRFTLKDGILNISGIENNRITIGMAKLCIIHANTEYIINDKCL